MQRAPSPRLAVIMARDGRTSGQLRPPRRTPSVPNRGNRQSVDPCGRALHAARGKLVFGTPSPPGPMLTEFNGRMPMPVAARELACRPLSMKRC